MTIVAKLQPWDRRPDESGPAFEAFALYRDAGPGRTVATVASECHKGVSILNRWSQRHDWVDRAAAYDTEVARRAAVKAVESDAAALARQVRQARAIQAKAVKRFQGADAAADLSAAEAARVWALAAKEEREARRLPAKVDVKHGGSVGVWFGFDEEVAQIESRAGAPGEIDDDDGDDPSQ